LVSLQILEERFQYDYYMHADDDSYVRLDLILQLLVSRASCANTNIHLAIKSAPGHAGHG
jgi:hypothetical protein